MDTTTAEVYHRTLLQRATDVPMRTISRAWGWLRANSLVAVARKILTGARSLLTRARSLFGRVWRVATKYVPAPLMAMKVATTPALVQLGLQAVDLVANSIAVALMYANQIITLPLQVIPATRALRSRERAVVTQTLLTVVDVVEKTTDKVWIGYRWIAERPVFALSGAIVNGVVVASAVAVFTGIAPLGWAAGAAVGLLGAIPIVQHVRSVNDWGTIFAGDIHTDADNQKGTMAYTGKSIMDMTREELAQEMSSMFPDRAAAPKVEEQTKTPEETLAAAATGQSHNGQRPRGPRNQPAKKHQR